MTFFEFSLNSVLYFEIGRVVAIAWKPKICDEGGSYGNDGADRRES
jgi:hypothetical protein